jgi:hypothetical protein
LHGRTRRLICGRIWFIDDHALSCRVLLSCGRDVVHSDSSRLFLKNGGRIWRNRIFELSRRYLFEFGRIYIVHVGTYRFIQPRRVYCFVELLD